MKETKKASPIGKAVLAITDLKTRIGTHYISTLAKLFRQICQKLIKAHIFGLNKDKNGGMRLGASDFKPLAPACCYRFH